MGELGYLTDKFLHLNLLYTVIFYNDYYVWVLINSSKDI